MSGATSIFIGDEAVFRIGLGMSKIGTQDAYSSEHIKQRLDVLDYATNFGRIFVDTSSIYGGGFSEEIIGAFVKAKREKFFLATKFYVDETKTTEQHLAAVNSSLRRLKTENVDLLQVHWPNALATEEKICEVLETINAAGIAKQFGVCNFYPFEYKALQKTLKSIHIVSNQIEMSLAANCLPPAEKTISGVNIGFGLFGKGELTTTPQQKKLLDDLAAQKKVTANAIMLAKILKAPNTMALIRTSKIANFNSLLAAFNVTLSRTETDSIDSASSTNIVEIDADEIQLIGDRDRKPYLSESEAIANELELIPSPVSLAHRFRYHAIPIPLRIRIGEQGKYTIDVIDPIGDMKIYWGWRLAYPKSKIPCILTKGF